MQFESNEIAHTAAGVEEEREDRSGSHVLAQLDLSKQPPDLAPSQSLRSEVLATKFFDGFGGVRFQVTVLGKPSEIATDGDQATIDRRHGLPLFSTQVILEVGHIPDGNSLHGEWLSVRHREPTSKLSEVGADRPASVRRHVVGGEIPTDKTSFVRPDRQALENIIARILAIFSAQIRHHLDTDPSLLG